MKNEPFGTFGLNGVAKLAKVYPDIPIWVRPASAMYVLTSPRLRAWTLYKSTSAFRRLKAIDHSSLSIGNWHRWSRLLKQHTSITVYCLPTKENKWKFVYIYIYVVHSKSNWKTWIKTQWLLLAGCLLFTISWRIHHRDEYTCCTDPARPEGGGELVNADTSRDPIPRDLEVVGGNPSLQYGGEIHRGIFSVEKPLPGHHFQLLLPEYLQEDAQDLHDVDGVDLGACLHSCLDEAWFALVYPLFGSIVSSIRTISSNIERERRWMAVTNSWQVLTRSCFCSSLRSFGTLLADFFTRPWSSLRMLKTVPMESPCAVARSLQLTRRSSETLAATAKTISADLSEPPECRYLNVSIWFWMHFVY